MRFVSHSGALSCLEAGGAARSIADKIAFGRCVADVALITRARDLGNPCLIAGRIYSSGTWRDSAVHHSSQKRWRIARARAA